MPKMNKLREKLLILEIDSLMRIPAFIGVIKISQTCTRCSDFKTAFRKSNRGLMQNACHNRCQREEVLIERH